MILRICDTRRLARYGFSSDRSGRHYSIKRAEGRSPEQLLADFDSRNAWAGTSSVFPDRLNLMDRLVHHQDIRRALGHEREIPLERTAPLLEFLGRQEVQARLQALKDAASG